MPETITADALRQAADLISDRRRWTRRVYARNERGVSTDPLAPTAVRWCMLGALEKVSAVERRTIYRALQRLDSPGTALAQLNDGPSGRLAAIAELRRLADLAERRERAANHG